MNNYNSIQSDLFASSFGITTVNTNSRTAVTSSVPTLGDYAAKVENRVWPKVHTRRPNMRGIRWFTEYKDFGQLTLAEV